MISTKDELNEKTLEFELQDISKRLFLEDLGEALYFPKYFQLETVRLCNSRCPFCFMGQSDKSVPFMSDELYSKIVEELGHYSEWINFVAVQRGGEPLLDKKLGQRIRMLKDAGIKIVNLSTNASLLDEDKAVELLNAGLDEIMFSIDSIEKEEYEKMRVGLNYENVMRNIKTFFRLRDNIKPETIIRVRGVSFFDFEIKEDKEKINAWESFWNTLKRPHDRIYMKKAHNWGGQREWEGHMTQYDLVYHPCILPWSTMHIKTDGTVPLCGIDYDGKVKMGDLKKNSIAEIWSGKEWKWLRNLHENGRRNEMKLCRGCKLFDSDFSMEHTE